MAHSRPAHLGNQGDVRRKVAVVSGLIEALMGDLRIEQAYRAWAERHRLNELAQPLFVDPNPNSRRPVRVGAAAPETASTWPRDSRAAPR